MLEYIRDWKMAGLFYKIRLIVTIEKKINPSECEDHRTINLIAHASKIMLGKRLENKSNTL